MEKTAGEYEYTSLADYTLRTAPWRVISYSFASGASSSHSCPRGLADTRVSLTGIMGGTGGATIAVMRNILATPAAVSAGARTGVFGFTFFCAWRDWIVIRFIELVLTSRVLQPSGNTPLRLSSPTSPSTLPLSLPNPTTLPYPSNPPTPPTSSTPPSQVC